MLLLIIAAIAWVALHVIVAGPLRAGLIAGVGEARYRGIFSGLSAVSLAFLIWAFGRAPYVESPGVNTEVGSSSTRKVPPSLELLHAARASASRRPQAPPP